MMASRVAGIFLLGFLLAWQAQDASTTATQSQASSRPPLILLYDCLPDPNAIARVQSIQANPYLLIYQGCDPQSFKSGMIDSAAVIKEIDKQTGGVQPEWGMLDFEEPFNSDLQKGIESPECKRALQTMIATLQAVKARFPNTKWTYYGVPFTPYWDNGKNWTNSTSEAKRKMLDRIAAIYSSLVKEEDWVSVSIYPVYEPELYKPEERNGIREQGRAWRIVQVGLAKLLAGKNPVIPTVTPYWQPNGLANDWTILSNDQFIQDVVQPAIKAGARGIAIWTAADSLIAQLTQDSIPMTAATSRQKFREAFALNYFSNQMPPSWSEPKIKEQLEVKISRTITDSLLNIRASEQLGSNP